MKHKLNQLQKCAEKLGYNFSDETLLKVALTHRSFSHKNHNERLEFLGDAILNFVIGTQLFQLFPDAAEGELTRFRAALVSGKSLASLAEELDLNNYILLGPAEIKNGRIVRQSIMSDTLEAIIGAIYLDNGIGKCEQIIWLWFEERLQQLVLAPIEKDYKTQLQEFFQARSQALPSYCVALIDGKMHAQTFHVECRVEGFDYVTKGLGSSRRQAEQMAAMQYLDFLKKSINENA